MSNLSQDLELLRELNENRRRAKELREQALYALKKIKVEKRLVSDGQNSPHDGTERQSYTYKYEDKDEDNPEDRAQGQQRALIQFERWVAATDDVEIALLVKVQNHRELSERDNNDVVSASETLQKELTGLRLDRLHQQGDDATNSSTYPVLLAARAMQALVNRAATVFEPAAMYCYYRIIRELYGAAHPNWTVGAARAGVGGTTSAFVTNECIRAIFAFENALNRTYEFFKHTGDFYEYFSSLDCILEKWGIEEEGGLSGIPKEKSPLYAWANQSIEARWLDCQIATNPRNREMALFCSKEQDSKKTENVLLLPDRPEKGEWWIENARDYFKSLPRALEKAVDDLRDNVEEVRSAIEVFRAGEDPKNEPQKTEPTEERVYDEKTAKFNRTATAHLFALRAIEDAVLRAGELQKLVKERDLKQLLAEMAKAFYKIRRRVHHVLEPSKQYLKWVIGRELAASPATFDAGELVFAATSFGAINNWGRDNWRLDDRLTRACELLVNSLPDTGRLPTKRPFHATRRGYRTIPIGCEMTRALATLLQKTGYDFDAKFGGRMLGIFEENIVELNESTADDKLVGWNFEGAPDPDKPAVWVTAVSVLALDRIVRMLNTRINEIVLAHFDVTQPERPHTQLTLRHLIYSDYALVKMYPEGERELTAIRVQKARAHVMRATLPEQYRKDDKNFSAIYYGPPNTGKTTLAEALALSARVPLLRLSPGDLILQGQELIEGRAHDVFEALSMLTQCVIIFDEFDAVLRNRGNEIELPSRKWEDYQYEFERIWQVLRDISEKDDPKFRFVVGGMLPKLIKLHDSAKKQSFGYCLGTNYLKNIDQAAKREGRFDRQIPVYKPDALSRAGALLYWLGRSERITTPATATQLRRFFATVAGTTGEPADRISKLFRIEDAGVGSGDAFRKYIHGPRPLELPATLKFILTIDNEPMPNELKKAQQNLDGLKKELLSPGQQKARRDGEENEGIKPKDDAAGGENEGAKDRSKGAKEEDEEETERRRIFEYEEAVVGAQQKLEDDNETNKGTIINILNKCLEPQRQP